LHQETLQLQEFLCVHSEFGRTSMASLRFDLARPCFPPAVE
jgi:hypothetical protein